MVSRPASVTARRPATGSGQEGGWLATGETAARPRVALPSFGTLIILVFLAFTGFRLLGELVRGIDLTPTVTNPPNQAIVPGSIIFGTASDGNCGVVEAAHDFVAGAEVWWSARLASQQRADAEVVVIVRRDGIEVDREVVPADPPFGAWSVLCAGAPVKENSAGLYLVEVWDSTVTTRHAIGEYRLTAS
jgi:hypothetical protein